jgi:MFS transporter, BCD family, chlorophyll transporter
MAVLALGGVGAALARPGWHRRWAGMALAVLSFSLIGLGVSASRHLAAGAAGQAVARSGRAAAATMVWMMMIVGFAVTAGVAGQLARPLHAERLVAVSAAVSPIAFLLWPCWRCRALVGSRSRGPRARAAGRRAQAPLPRRAARGLGRPDARRFTIFVFVSMLAYSAQDLILEPFAGIVFGFTPGESTQLSGVQHGGVLAGMLLARWPAGAWRGRRFGFAARLDGRRLPGLGAGAARPGAGRAGRAGLAAAANGLLLGVANGAFSIAAIGSMMALAGQGRSAAKACAWACGARRRPSAFALGGLSAPRPATWPLAARVPPAPAYATVFASRR